MNWLRRVLWFLPWPCKHEHVRCTHGDEIIGRKWRRRVCLDCGRALKGQLPIYCYVTGKPHPSYRNIHPEVDA